MNKENEAVLPDEFKEGPWLTAQELMKWLGLNLSKDGLKSWRARGILAYTTLGGIILYNKPWILRQLADGWTWRQRKPKLKK